jgi:CBS-domain-containing membrane protein
MAFETNHGNAWHTDFEHVAVLFEHLRMAWLLEHLPPRLVWSIYVGVNGFATIGLLGLLALVTKSPFVFPSLGPTAYLFFFSPLAEASSPRNAILGHAIGLICGYTAFAVTSGFGPSFAVQGEVHLPRVLAAALALSATGALMAMLGISHPPAGATTLIVALSIIYQPSELIVIEIAVILLTAQAFVIHRTAGIHYPLWRAVSTLT